MRAETSAFCSAASDEERLGIRVARRSSPQGVGCRSRGRAILPERRARHFGSCRGFAVPTRVASMRLSTLWGGDRGAERRGSFASSVSELDRQLDAIALPFRQKATTPGGLQQPSAYLSKAAVSVGIPCGEIGNSDPSALRLYRPVQILSERADQMVEDAGRHV